MISVIFKAGMVLFSLSLLSCEDARQAQLGVGFKLHSVCSGIFHQNLSMEQIEENLAMINPILGKIPVKVNQKEKSVSVLKIKKAYYQPGFGCTLDKNLALKTPRRNIIRDDIADKPLHAIDQQDLENYVHNKDHFIQVVQDAFAEEDPRAPGGQTRSVVISYKDKILAEKYGRGFTEKTPQIGWSMTKSVTAILAVLAIQDGLLSKDTELSSPLLNFMSSPEKTTLDDVLQMKLGLSYNEDYDNFYSDVYEMLLVKANMTSYVLKQPRVASPGTTYNYSTGTSQVAAAILRTAFTNDNDYWNYPTRRLFKPLGLTSAEFSTDSTGTFVGGAWLYLTARDWTRFGLFLMNTALNTKSILNPDLLQWLLEPVTEDQTKARHFTINTDKKTWPDLPEDAFAAIGHFGQYILVIPSQELVIVRLGQSTRGGFNLNNFGKKILAQLIP